MSVSPLLEFPLLSESQSQKTASINEALQAMEAALEGKYVQATSAAVSLGFDIVLPYDDTNDLTTRQALRFMYLELEAGAAHNFDVIHPAKPHMFIVKNLTTKIATFKVDGGSGYSLSVPAGSLWLLYTDGEGFTRLEFTVNTLVQAVDYQFSFWGKPEPSVAFGSILVAREVTIANDMAGAVGLVAVAPTIARDLDVLVNGVSVGTISIDTSGVFTFVTAGAEVVLAAGDVIRVENSAATADTTLEDIQVSIPGLAYIDQGT